MKEFILKMDLRDELFEKLQEQYMELISRQKQEYFNLVNRIDLNPRDRQNISDLYEDLIMGLNHEFGKILKHPIGGYDESFNLDLKSGRVIWKSQKESQQKYEKYLQKEREEQQELEQFEEMPSSPFSRKREPIIPPKLVYQHKKQAPNSPGDGPNMECAVCGSVSTKRCAGCKEAAYCSQKCQAINWHIHSKICNK